MTSSKEPALIELQGRKEFVQMWDCIVNKKEKTSKNFRNFQRGIKFEPSSVECFRADSGLKVTDGLGHHQTGYPRGRHAENCRR